MTIARDLANVALLIASSNTNVVFDETIVLNAGTANSLVYLNGNKEATTLSTLSFNGTNLGVNNSSPGSALDVKGTVRISGAVSGYVGLAVASNAGAVTYTLPASDGLNGNVLSTNGAGSLIWIPMTGGGGGANTGSGSSTSRTTLVATEGQTSFSVTYVVGQIDIFLNGVKLAIGTEVTANTGTTAVLAKGAKAGDIFDAVVYSTQWNTSVTNLYYDGGNIGIGTSIPNYSSFGGTNRVLSIKGSSTYGALELVSDAAPADGNFLGQFVFANAGSGVTSKDSVLIAAKQSGASATAPGGSLHFYTRTNAGSLTERATISATGEFEVNAGNTLGTRIDGLRLRKGVTNAANYLAWQQGANGWRLGINYNDGSYPLVFLYGDSIPTASAPGTERMRLDSSGNLGIGTTSPATKLDVQGTGAVIRLKQNATGSATYYQMDNTVETGGKIWRFGYTGGSGIPTFSLLNQTDNVLSWVADASGNLGLGVTPSAWTRRAMQLDAGGSAGYYAVSNGTAVFASNVYYGSGDKYVNTNYAGYYSINPANGLHIWATAPSGSAGANVSFTQAMTLDASGNLLVRKTSLSNMDRGVYIYANDSNGSRVGVSGDGTTSASLFVGTNESSGAFVFQVLGNGNVQNINNSYGAISDVKLKENIVDATPKLEKLKQVRIVNYNIKGDAQKQIGVIAQELEQIFPGMIEETPDRDDDGELTGETTKSVKYSVFVPMLIKAIQEQQVLITSLSDRLSATETELAAIKAKLPE